MDIPWNLVRNGVTPPPPGSSESCRSLDNVGQNLLALVRSLEKSDSSNHTKQVKEVAEILKNLLAVYSRRGLLQGDVTKVEKIINTSGQGSAMVGGGRREKRSRKSGNRGSKNEIRVYDQDGDTGGVSNNASQDESLVLSSLVRILGGSSGNEFESSSKQRHDLSLISVAAQIVTLLTERIKSLISCDVCASAENELIAASGRTLLTGFSRTIHTILSKMLSDSTDGSGNRIFLGFYAKQKPPNEFGVNAHTWYSGQEAKVLSECLRASASLLTLFGTRLSRSSSILAELSTAGWSALTIPNDGVQRSAAALLASLPLTGSVQKSTPANTWTVCVVESVAAIFYLLDTIKVYKKTPGKVDHTKHISNDTRALLDDWNGLIRQSLQDARQRAKAFSTLMHGFVTYLLALLNREGYDSLAQSVLSAAQMPVDYMLDLSESMMSFTTSAEGMYYSTKKRLRMEPIKGGLLSPTTVAFDVSNTVKALGHDVLDAAVSSLGGPGALPHGRRIMRIVYASLLTSCSGPLRKVLDPTGAMKLDGKRKRWLHTSIPMRARAVKSFRLSIAACGSNAVISPSTGGGVHDLNSRNDSSRSITVVAGCLLEQITWKGSGEVSFDEDWGGLVERVELAALAAETLATCLVVCRGFMQQQTRSLVDSVVSSCISSMTGKDSSQLCSWAPARTALLNLGAKCICTPWPDGAMSSLTEVLRQASSVCKYDRDANVSTAAHTALCICDALAMPRAPPLSVITHGESVSGDAGHGNAHISASLLSKGNNEVREDLAEKIIANSKAFGKENKMDSTREKKRAKLEESATSSEKMESIVLDGDKEETNLKNAEDEVKPPPVTAATSLTVTEESRTDSGSQNYEENKKEMKSAINTTTERQAVGDNAVVIKSTSVTVEDAAEEKSATHKKLLHETVRVVNTKGPDPEKEVPVQVKSNGVANAKEGSDTENESDLPDIFDCEPDDDDM